jgi:hypothetical protein
MIGSNYYPAGGTVRTQQWYISSSGSGHGSIYNDYGDVSLSQ